MLQNGTLHEAHGVTPSLTFHFHSGVFFVHAVLTHCNFYLGRWILQAPRHLMASPPLPPNNTYYGAPVQRAFCTACNMCLRYTETRVPLDLCYLQNGMRTEEPDCALNCRICYTASSDTVTVEMQVKVMASEALVNSTLDPVRPLSDFLSTSTNASATVFFLSYVEPWASADRGSASGPPCQDASSYTGIFLVQWRTRNVTAGDERTQMMTLFQGDDFVRLLRSTYPSICSVTASNYIPPPIRTQGANVPVNNATTNPDVAATTIDNTDPSQVSIAISRLLDHAWIGT